MARKHRVPNNRISNVIGYPQSEANRKYNVPKTALNNYELDLQTGAIPPDTTFEQWRQMQRGVGVATAYKDVNDHLIINLTDGSIVDVGNIKGDAFTYEDFTSEQINGLVSSLQLDLTQLKPIANGALPTPSGSGITMKVVGGSAGATWTHATLPSGSASLLKDQAGEFYWNSTSWALTNVVDLPVTPVDGTVAEGDERAVSGSEVYENLKFGVDEDELTLKDEINPLVTIWSSSDVVDNRGHNAWFTGVSTKRINCIGIPIVHGYSSALTGGVHVMLALNGNWILKKLIPFSKISSYNSLNLLTSPINDFLYYLDVDEFELKEDDLLYTGIYTENPDDKLGFYYTQNLTDEWDSDKGGYSSNNGVGDYATPPARVSNPNQYSFQFYYRDSFFKTAVTKIINENPTIIENSYFSKDLVRNSIGTFLNKLRLKQDVKIVCYGNSIIQFQNSETLSLSEQQVNPIGLSGNSWVRQMWEMLQYKDTDVQYRRFDHSDFTFSNGIQSTSSVIGSFGWATNRNDTSESWRNQDVNTGFAQSITPSSSFSKPLVGTNKIGEKFSITIPSTATSVDIIFAVPQLNKNVNIKIGSEINETIILNSTNTVATEFVKTYTITSGASKVLEVTNVDGTAFWVWGVSWKSKPSVRVINSGSGGYNVSLLNDTNRFQQQVEAYNPDLVIFEVTSSNDINMSISLSSHSELVDSLMTKLKELDTPVIVILTHRFETQFINREETSKEMQESIKFIPEVIKNFKASAHKNQFGLIDIFRKSVDILGQTNTVVLPPNFFVDNGHLGVNGNKMYVEELEKLFLINDFE